VIDHEPTVRDRYVGQELLRAAQKCGRNSGEMAELLGWSPSKVSRLLSGQRMTSTEDVSAYLALCGVVGPRRAELLALAARRYEPLWWQDHGTRAPVRNTVLVDNEDRAVGITSFGDTLVPDLLQVPAYTRALLAAHPTIPDHEIEERVAETQRRQRILDREFGPPQLRVFLAAYALTRTGAGDAVMSEQAYHLLELTVQAKVSIRIVPDDGVRDIGPFTLLEFAAHQPAICLEHATTTVCSWNGPRPSPRTAPPSPASTAQRSTKQAHAPASPTSRSAERADHVRPSRRHWTRDDRPRSASSSRSRCRSGRGDWRAEAEPRADPRLAGEPQLVRRAPGRRVQRAGRRLLPRRHAAQRRQRHRPHAARPNPGDLQSHRQVRRRHPVCPTHALSH
jgi:hypothetical protein